MGDSLFHLRIGRGVVDGAGGGMIGRLWFVILVGARCARRVVIQCQNAAAPTPAGAAHRRASLGDEGAEGGAGAAGAAGGEGGEGGGRRGLKWCTKNVPSGLPRYGPAFVQC